MFIYFYHIFKVNICVILFKILIKYIFNQKWYILNVVQPKYLKEKLICLWFKLLACLAAQHSITQENNHNLSIPVKTINFAGKLVFITAKMYCFASICRICLTSNKIDLINLNKSDNDNIKINDKLTFCIPEIVSYK